MVNISWSVLALEDLKSIHDYISKDSKSYADLQILKVIERVEQLKNFPQSGRIVPEFGKTDIREIVEGNYRIIFRFRDKNRCC